MEALEIKQAIDSIGKAVEALRSEQEQKIKSEAKGVFDGLIEEKMRKINNDIDGLTEFKQKAEIALSRTHKGGDGDDDKANAEYKAAFSNYVRKGKECDILEQKAMTVGISADGGFLVTPTMSSEITKLIYETSPLRQLASVQVIGTDSFELMEDIDDLTSGWVGETDAIIETSTPQLGKRIILVHGMYAQPKASQKLLDDANVNIEQWLAGKIADRLARIEATAFISGDGNGKPQGILNYPAGVNVWAQVERVSSGAANAITVDGIVNLFYALKVNYVQNSSFLMNRAAIRAIRLLKDTTGQFIWQAGLQAGQPDNLLGRPIYQAKDMPSGITVAGTLAMAFGDFKQAYQIVDRMGIQTLRDPFTEKPFVKFYATKRVGGAVKNTEAYKLLAIGA